MGKDRSDLIETRDIYLDYAATTPVDPRVIDEMHRSLEADFANPNSLHSPGRRAFRVLETARGRFQEGVGACDPREIVFTGSGTESDDSALLGIARATGKGSGHIVVSSFEHSAVLEAARMLSKEGYRITYVDPDHDGIVHPDALKDAMSDDTVLVSVMHVNNELGTVQDVAALAAVVQERGALFHTDAAQSLGKMAFNVKTLGVDAASFSSHKIYGPKGVGALYLRRGTPFSPYIVGGGQEAGRRSGTQNVAGVVGMTVALSLMCSEMKQESARLGVLAKHMIDRITEEISDSRISGDPAKRLPNITNLQFAGIEGESLLLQLDRAGYAVSTGSACSSKDMEPSHVLKAIRCPSEYMVGSIRVSLGRPTTPEQVDGFCDALKGCVERLRVLEG